MSDTSKERMAEFVREAMEADAAIDAGADVYGAEDVYAWLERLAEGGKQLRPAPSRRVYNGRYGK